MSGWGTGWLVGLKSVDVETTIDLNKWPEETNIIANIPKFLNKHPTHDPYTNPNSHIYYECGCGSILDPGTKSFAALNNHASEAGWKVRWGADSYVPWCVKCGEGVE